MAEYPETKRCSRCGRELRRAEFYRNKGRPDGIQTVCKDCTRAINAERSAADPEWWRVYKRSCVKPEETRLRDLERAKRWRQDNPERNRANNKRWQAANRDKAREIGRKRTATRKARKLGAYVEAVDALVVLERADGVCGICGIDVDPLAFEVDHVVPLARGGEHSYANTQPAHRSCNRRKWCHMEIAA